MGVVVVGVGVGVEVVIMVTEITLVTTGCPHIIRAIGRLALVPTLLWT